MWVEAILAKNDLEKAMNDFCPLSIQCDGCARGSPWQFAASRTE